MKTVLASPLWSSDYPAGLRIPWHLAKLASTSLNLRADFMTPGLYLFCSAAGVPLYLGMTEGPLWGRLRGRYIGGPQTQFQLAALYENALLAYGLAGFPQEVRQRRSKVRQAHALALAQHGIAGIWFTLIPVADQQLISQLEKLLIPIANAWNRSQGYQALLNQQYV